MVLYEEDGISVVLIPKLKYNTSPAFNILSISKKHALTPIKAICPQNIVIMLIINAIDTGQRRGHQGDKAGQPGTNNPTRYNQS